MIVVSDTSVISTLIRIGKLSLLHQVFGRIIIPVEVANELDRIFPSSTDSLLAQN